MISLVFCFNLSFKGVKNEFVFSLKQTERNEVIFHEKRASAYKGKTVEFFVKALIKKYNYSL